MINNNNFIKILVSSNDVLFSISLFLLRGTIGIILFVVGAGKVLGWFNGMGMEQTIKMFFQIGISTPFTYLSCYTEFIGGLLITIGIFTRPVAFIVMINMIVATYVALPGGFLAPNGAVLPFTFLICSIAILIAGPMNYSIDNLLFIKS